MITQEHTNELVASTLRKVARLSREQRRVAEHIIEIYGCTPEGIARIKELLHEGEKMYVVLIFILLKKISSEEVAMQPINGTLWKARVMRWMIKESEKIGEIPERLVQNPEEYLSTLYSTLNSRLDMIIRTESNRVYNHALLASFKAEGHTKVKINVIIDDRTSAICMGYVGQIYDIDNVPFLPAHPNCRSTYQKV